MNLRHCLLRLVFFGLCLLPEILLASSVGTLGSNTDNIDKSLTAKKITFLDMHRTPRGHSTVAGVGDWLLSNGTLCAHITDIEHETFLSWRGGTLVDLGFCQRGDDQWKTYHELFNLSQSQIIPSNSIHVETDENTATLIVEGSMAGVNNKTTYSLNRYNPEQLFIETELTRVTEGDRLFLFGALILHPSRSLTPFSVDSSNVKFNKGFEHPEVDTSERVGMLDVMFPLDLHVLVGADHLTPEISYGVHALETTLIKENGEEERIRQFAINAPNFTLIGNFTNPLWFDTEGQPGLMQFAQTLFMDLEVGETLRLRKTIYVSRQADVASITNRLYTGDTLVGQLESANQRVLVTTTDGKPLTYAKPNADLSYTVAVPESVEYEIETRGMTEQQMARLDLPVGKTVHLVFKGEAGSEDPVFNPDRTGFRAGEKFYPTDITSNRVSLAGIPSDKKFVYLPPGDYRVYATRGIEYSITEIRLQVEAGKTYQLQMDMPVKVVQTPQWISADFHMHSVCSFDSTLPKNDRAIDFYAQGGEVMVPSEHKHNVDFQPVLIELELVDHLVQIPGIELTGMARSPIAPRTIGHSNVFPVTIAENQFLGGSFPHENLRLGQIIDSYKANDAVNVFQLNHARNDEGEDDDMCFLDHLSIDTPYRADQPLTAHANKSLLEEHEHSHYRDIDFDAMEVMNGKEYDVYEKLKVDWFSFLSQGHIKTATANSDSHSSGALVAIPRNYVFMQDDSINGFDQATFVQAVLDGKLFGTTGPILNVSIGNANIGDTYRGAEASVKVWVDAAPWVPVSRLVLYVNGEQVAQQSISETGLYQFPLTVEKDSYVVVEASGEASGLYEIVFPDYKPLAFSNAVYIDADNDGQWQSPGL